MHINVIHQVLCVSWGLALCNNQYYGNQQVQSVKMRKKFVTENGTEGIRIIKESIRRYYKA